MLKLLLDMGLPPASADFLRTAGCDAVHLRELGLHKLDDESVMARAEAEGRVLVTFDLDFGRLLALHRKTSPSTVVFRLESFTVTELNNLLDRVLKTYEDELVHGAVLSVDDTSVRLRRLPIW